MSTGIPTTYHYIQRAPLCFVVYATAVALAAAAYFVREQAFVSVELLVVAALVGVLGSCFHYLAISDGGDFLSISFGPVPLFRRRTLCLGTDDPQGLLAFLKGKLTMRAIGKLGV